MSAGLHLSVRVPWHDGGWAGTVCQRPLDNASCILLKNIGDSRDDEYEATHAGKPIELVNPNRLPCIGERASFMSPHSYQLTKEHPYRFSQALKGLLAPTPVVVPAYGVHATPYFWLHRKNVPTVLRAVDVDYREELEEFVNETLRFTPQWVIHGDNQRSLIERFFADVRPGGLVFFYLKHSPFTAAGTSGGRSLLVGAARITDIDLPDAWRTAGQTPFPNHMWETNVRHSLRPDGVDGVLLPMAELAALELDPDELGDALAWAPEYGGREFMYVTEHVSDDTAIAGLERLYRAAERCLELGLEVPRASMDWLSERIAELWTMRGPAPGLGAVLEALSVPHGPVVARAVSRLTPEGVDPWDFLDQAMDEPAKLSPDLAKKLSGTPRKVWRAFDADERRFLKLLSRFNLTVEQAAALGSGDTEIALEHTELMEDPYHAYTCLLGGLAEVAFDVIDRGCFPEASVRAAFPLDEPSAMVDAADERRVQALLTAVCEEAAASGDTVVPLDRMLAAVRERPLVEPCPLTEQVLRAHGLHPSMLTYDEESPYWPPVCGTVLADGTPAFKLTRLETTSRVIRQVVDDQLARARRDAPDDVRAVLDDALPRYSTSDAADAEAEQRAREEKAAALDELFRAPLAVLNGRAGTGKTTLIRALANHPAVHGAGVLLLAPTGKARVQLTKKVKLPAHTLAQFLGRYGRYDADTGTYHVDSDRPKAPRFGTVIVDESSMLTEEQLAALLDALHAPDRLVLVGDPRQLPPIGAGRPFVDLINRLVAESEVPAFPRVTPGYTELTVLRRQAGQVRDDLMLAGWFAGDEIPDGFEEVWQRLRQGTEMATLAARPWGTARPEQAIDDALAAELGITGPKASAKFELSYGGRENGPWVNFPTGDKGAGERSEEWQILSPTRTNPWGTIEVNRRLKRKHRGKALKDALRPPYERKVPAPTGAEQIVLGDKVLNNLNQRKKAWPAGPDALDYVANGEIGVVVGQVGRIKGAAPRFTNVEFSSQTGHTYGYSGDSEENPALELAWAITVHKAQGSEFGKVFVLLPGSSRRLSRELLYTALTRQKDKVVLLHERPIDELFELTRSTGSETARRLTDLFTAPAPRAVLLPDGTAAGVLDTNLIHVAPNGVLVRSKNEVIIAGILEDLAPGGWEYEKPLEFGGVKRFPDFTVPTPGGRTVYWEHLGMIDNPQYQAAWERKLGWYREQGVLPHEEGGGPAGTLLCTDDQRGVDVPGWTELARSVLGAGPSGPRVASRRAAKKAAPGVARSRE
ncbi:AAA family ATPase [Micromonospora carbonacea]|uniref:AAA family ATPase n=1 Tax=Micromonospora carbonacea TaxID=47853 RepID=UPI00331BD2D5